MESSTNSGNASEDDDLDYFEESLGAIFGDVIVSHGEPGNFYNYTSQTRGTIRLRLTLTESWEEQLKFSHYIWVSELHLAQRIESNDIDLKGLRVLELGAGAGLCGILAVHGGAREVVLSDYPAPSMLQNLKFNVEANITPQELSCTKIVGHIWGESVEVLGNRFDVILLGDCLWMPEQHDALCQTLAATLKKNGEARVYCVAGFHSGRVKLAPFFTKIAKYGLVANADMHELNHDGSRREWNPNGHEMDPIERKRWLVVSELRWKQN